MNVMLHEKIPNETFDRASADATRTETPSAVWNFANGVIVVDVDGLDHGQLAEILHEHRTATDCLLARTASTDTQHWRRLRELGADAVVHPRAKQAEMECAAVSARFNRAQREELQRRVQELERKLEDRIVIERAKGIIASRAQIGEEEALRRLRREARNQRRSMREVAQTLLDAERMLNLPG